MGDTAMNIPVPVRSHELRQVKDMMSMVAGDLKQAELEESSEEVKRIYDEHLHGLRVEPRENGEFAAYLSMPPEDWRMTIRYLNRAMREEGRLRVNWLQNKLVSRVEEQMEGVGS